MLENIRLAFQGIWSHKMRSFLTMLGIIIGIASIIAIVSTIKGTSEQIKEDLIGSGNNTVQVLLYDGDSTYDMDYGSYGSSAARHFRFAENSHWRSGPCDQFYILLQQSVRKCLL